MVFMVDVTSGGVSVTKGVWAKNLPIVRLQSHYPYLVFGFCTNAIVGRRNRKANAYAVSLGRMVFDFTAMQKREHLDLMYCDRGAVPTSYVNNGDNSVN